MEPTVVLFLISFFVFFKCMMTNLCFFFGVYMQLLEIAQVPDEHVSFQNVLLFTILLKFAFFSS